MPKWTQNKTLDFSQQVKQNLSENNIQLFDTNYFITQLNNFIRDYRKAHPSKPLVLSPQHAWCAGFFERMATHFKVSFDNFAHMEVAKTKTQKNKQKLPSKISRFVDGDVVPKPRKGQYSDPDYLDYDSSDEMTEEEENEALQTLAAELNQYIVDTIYHIEPVYLARFHWFLEDNPSYIDLLKYQERLTRAINETLKESDHYLADSEVTTSEGLVVNTSDSEDDDDTFSFSATESDELSDDDDRTSITPLSGSQESLNEYNEKAFSAHQAELITLKKQVVKYHDALFKHGLKFFMENLETVAAELDNFNQRFAALKENTYYHTYPYPHGIIEDLLSTINACVKSQCNDAALPDGFPIIMELDNLYDEFRDILDYLQYSDDESTLESEDRFNSLCIQYERLKEHKDYLEHFNINTYINNCIKRIETHLKEYNHRPEYDNNSDYSSNVEPVDNFESDDDYDSDVFSELDKLSELVDMLDDTQTSLSHTKPQHTKTITALPSQHAFNQQVKINLRENNINLVDNNYFMTQLNNFIRDYRKAHPSKTLVLSPKHAWCADFFKRIEEHFKVSFNNFAHMELKAQKQSQKTSKPKSQIERLSELLSECKVDDDDREETDDDIDPEAQLYLYKNRDQLHATIEQERKEEAEKLMMEQQDRQSKRRYRRESF